ncbi:orotate phosphoribosyltransferase [Infirmifilum lucidum]|uniref:Orotate phosphoribosyltransferase n=1 Tax=Infirmifilum lucidum TaxID=2776706 RepID=A0A7L9FK37_9CREN|nr:orotate phosphoribosyltransferase [Infirmifilum lucidum]QOJ79165.1 orotate phosphoribosyltransferase [Infirmifilum lucidum]
MRVEELLWSIGAVQRGVFKLSSGRISNVYIDLRKLPSHPREFKLVVDALSREALNYSFNIVCGIAVGGLPLATGVALALSKPLIYVRRDRKDHGTMKQLEGDFEPGAKAILVDDVATTGGSLLEALKVLRSSGLIADTALVVVDREEGAREALEAEGVRLVGLTTLKRVLEVGASVQG